MNKFKSLFVSDKVIAKMRVLYPAWRVEEKAETYYRDKIRICTQIAIIGALFVLASVFSKQKEVLSDGRIQRNGYEKGDKKLSLIMEETSDVAEIPRHEINVTVSEKRYTATEIDELSEDFKENLMLTILGNNESFDYVTSDLKFVHSIDGYPFRVTYNVTKPLMISREGIINEENVIDGTDVSVTATITYFDYQEDYIFYVSLYRRGLSEDEEFIKAVEKQIAENDENTISNDYYKLPDRVNGKDIVFIEKKDNTLALIFVLIILSEILVYIYKDKELDKELKRREEALLLEYPRLINKFTLFYNAGMPIKKIWFKVCADYENESGLEHCLYEEMIITRNKIMDGKSEVEAYEEFGKRIGLRNYQVFISLIVQAIVMGKKELSKSLEMECQEAFNERRNKAKRLFEEAGTKLLIPMFMMLAVVVVIIIYPAFSSFGM